MLILEFNELPEGSILPEMFSFVGLADREIDKVAD
jgi:hypothetical protein